MNKLKNTKLIFLKALMILNVVGIGLTTSCSSILFKVNNDSEAKNAKKNDNATIKSPIKKPSKQFENLLEIPKINLAPNGYGSLSQFWWWLDRLEINLKSEFPNDDIDIFRKKMKTHLLRGLEQITNYQNQIDDFKEDAFGINFNSLSTRFLTRNLFSFSKPKSNSNDFKHFNPINGIFTDDEQFKAGEFIFNIALVNYFWNKNFLNYLTSKINLHLALLDTISNSKKTFLFQLKTNNLIQQESKQLIDNLKILLDPKYLMSYGSWWIFDKPEELSNITNDMDLNIPSILASSIYNWNNFEIGLFLKTNQKEKNITQNPLENDFENYEIFKDFVWPNIQKSDYSLNWINEILGTEIDEIIKTNIQNSYYLKFNFYQEIEKNNRQKGETNEY